MLVSVVIVGVVLWLGIGFSAGSRIAIREYCEWGYDLLAAASSLDCGDMVPQDGSVRLSKTTTRYRRYKTWNPEPMNDFWFIGLFTSWLGPFALFALLPKSKKIPTTIINFEAQADSIARELGGLDS